MAQKLGRWLAVSLLLSQVWCKRPSRTETTHATGRESPGGQSSSVAGKTVDSLGTRVVNGSGALHPALGGHPPSYWYEQGQRALSNQAPLPAEAWGGRFRYRTHIRGPVERPCLCQDRGGACEAGPVVRGLTWSRIPWARRANGQLEASVELVGVLSNEALTLTELPHRPPPVNEEETLKRFPLPCERPGQGWQTTDPSHAREEDQQAAIAYAEKQAEHSATWTTWDSFLTRRARSPAQKS